jgi:hypothetical protein
MKALSRCAQRTRRLRTEVDSRASKPSESFDSLPTLAERDAGLPPGDLAIKATALAGEELNH